MLVVVLIAAFLITFGAKALVGMGGRRAELPFLLVGGGAAVVAFSRAILGRIGSTFTDITDEYGSLLGWLLLLGGTLLVVIGSAIGQPAP